MMSSVSESEDEIGSGGCFRGGGEGGGEELLLRFLVRERLIRVSRETRRGKEGREERNWCQTAKSEVIYVEEKRPWERRGGTVGKKGGRDRGKEREGPWERKEGGSKRVLSTQRRAHTSRSLDRKASKGARGKWLGEGIGQARAWRRASEQGQSGCEESGREREESRRERAGSSRVDVRGRDAGVRGEGTEKSGQWIYVRE